MATMAVARSPVFTPSPSLADPEKRLVQPANTSQTPQRRRSLQKARTLVGSSGTPSVSAAAQPMRPARPGVGRGSSGDTIQPVRVDPASPFTPKQTVRVAWGATVTPPPRQHSTSKTFQPPKPRPEPEAEPESKGPEPEPEPEPESELTSESSLEPTQTAQLSLADLRAEFVRMDKHHSKQVRRAEVIHALQVDSKLRSMLGLAVNIGDVERCVLQAELAQIGPTDSYLNADDFVLYLIHHRLAYAASAPATARFSTTANPPREQVKRSPVIPELRPVSMPRTPGRASFSGLDTSFSKTWPWRDGANTAWSDLETQLIAAVATHLEPCDVVRAAGACSSWRRVILRRCQIDTAWAAMYAQKFGRLPRNCVGTSAAQRKFLETESMLRSAFRMRKLAMNVTVAVVGGWIYSMCCGAGFVLAGSLCGTATLVNTRTGELYKRLDGHKPISPGKLGTDCDAAAMGTQPSVHHEQFYCCAVAAAENLNEGDSNKGSDLQVVLGSNHALRFVRLAACDTATFNNLDESEEEPEPEEVEDPEAQLSYEQFMWLVRRQCRISTSQCPDNALRQLFDYVDKDRSGCISGSEFAEFLRQDTIGTFSVFDTAMAHIDAEFTVEKGYTVQSAFKAIDKDGSGALDVDELEAALSLLGLRLSRAEVMIVLAGLDEDGNGEISAAEFTKGMKVARRRRKQRAKQAETKTRAASKCEHTGDEKIESTEDLKTHELVATAFLRLYERLERKPDDETGTDTESGAARPAPKSPGASVASKKQKKQATTGGNSVMQAFRELDEDDSGTLNARELRAAFARLGVVLTRPALAEVMSELDADGSGTVDMAELLDRAFVSRLEAVRRRLVSSAVLMSSTADQWADLFDLYARGQKVTMEGPTNPEKIESLGHGHDATSKRDVYDSPNVVATSEEHGWVTQVTLVGHGGSPGTKQWRAAETVAVAYQDGTVESWSITTRLRLWTVPRAHKTNRSDEKAVVGLTVIGKGDSRLEQVSPAAIGQPPVFDNAIIVSVGQRDGIQLRDPLTGQCLRIIDNAAGLGCAPTSSGLGVETTAVCTFRHTVVCGGADGLIRAWSPDGNLKFSLLPERTLTPVASSDTPTSDASAADTGAHDSREIGRVVCLAANGDRIAAVDAYGTLRIWEPTCFSDHIPLPAANPPDTPQARASQRYFSSMQGDSEVPSVMVVPQFSAQHGEPGWLAHPIWSLSWDGPCKLWCGLESGQLAALDFSEQAAKNSPLVFRPPPKKPLTAGVKSIRSQQKRQRQQAMDRLSRPNPRWAKKSSTQEKIDAIFGHG